MRKAIIRGIENYIHKSSFVLLRTSRKVLMKRTIQMSCEGYWELERARGVKRQRQQLYQGEPRSCLSLKGMLCADTEKQKWKRQPTPRGRATPNLHFLQVVGTQLPAGGRQDHNLCLTGNEPEGQIGLRVCHYKGLVIC